MLDIGLDCAVSVVNETGASAQSLVPAWSGNPLVLL
jgi:hypothetical protein